MTLPLDHREQSECPELCDMMSDDSKLDDNHHSHCCHVTCIDHVTAQCSMSNGSGCLEAKWDLDVAVYLPLGKCVFDGA